MENKFVISGTLHEKGEVRFVGNKQTHRVQQFVITFQNDHGPIQYRFVEACKGAVDDLALIKVGQQVQCTGSLKGKEREGVSKSETMWKRFNNLDEINEISII